MKYNKVDRVLHIVSVMDRGGAETLLMNVYRNLDRSKLQFDFIVHRNDQGDYDNEIRKLGGKIYSVPSLGIAGPISYVKRLSEIMSQIPILPFTRIPITKVDFLPLQQKSQEFRIVFATLTATTGQ
ncbi:capsular polysaccharide biosynthesis protein [Mesobacillus boroniphilus JCM 21738]|uniref:Capsular polysaccharide biosynthesis protein n=1 Tax=Mesobacillus boroniphilus JCM 21738 TaxID=1294265 RepID=W4RKR2_9BACI|nr:capsular polysaccharide biosynthesis protein [Mesobacillus boroniphilus JCM 21738]